MKTLRRRSLALTIVLLLVVSCGATSCWAVRAAKRESAENLTVMISAFFPGLAEPSFGAGIIVSREQSTLYVVTATHVVRTTVAANKIQIGLRWLETVPAPETIARATFVRSEGDLAVLRVDLSGQAVPGNDVLLFFAIAGLAGMKHGDSIRPMGNPRNEHWVTCEEPDELDKVQVDALFFEERCIQPGDSGGPLLDDNWRIIGMMQRDEQPRGSALSIGTIIDKLKSWSIPVALAPANTVDANMFADFSVGVGVACGVTGRSRIFCWGSNNGDALGIGHERNLTATIGLPLADLHHFKSVSAGEHDACGLSLDGFAYCWGDFFDDGPKPQPVLVQNSPKFASISNGADHACALTSDQIAYCWGNNSEGQLGDGSKEKRSDPQPVAGGLRWLALSAGVNSTCGIATDHKAYCWGENLSHLSPNAETPVLIPAAVSGNLLFNQISISGQRDIGGEGRAKYACAVTVDGALYCWGGRARIFAGVTFPPDVSQPTEIAPGQHFLSVSTGKSTACAVDSSHNVVCMGGMVSGSHDPNVPKPLLPIKAVTDAERVSNSDTTACALRTNGKIVCWSTDIGDDDAMLGNGTVSFLDNDGLPDAFIPVKVSLCADQGIAKESENLTFDDLMEADSNAEMFQSKVGMLESLQEHHGGGHTPAADAVSGVFEQMERIDLLRQTAYGKVLACEILPKDPSVQSLAALRPLERALEQSISGVAEPPNFTLPAADSKEVVALRTLSSQYIVKASALTVPQE